MGSVLKNRRSESGLFVEEEVRLDQGGGGRIQSEVPHLHATQGGSEA